MLIPALIFAAIGIGVYYYTSEIQYHIANLTGKSETFYDKFNAAYNKTDRKVNFYVLFFQSCVETAYGSDYKARDYNNLFGLKGNVGDINPVEGSAFEEINGKLVKQSASWAAFSSWEKCIQYQINKYTSRASKYKWYEALEKKSLREIWQALKDKGYCTDSKYASKLSNIANKFGIDPDSKVV